MVGGLIMIKRLQTIKEVIHIIKVEDDVEERYECEKGEWIQFLTKIVADDRVLILASFNEYEEIVGYVVAQNAVVPPLGYYVHIIYAYSPGNKENFLMMEEIKKWALSIGAKEISATVKPEGIDRLLKYGFIESEFKILKFKINE